MNGRSLRTALVTGASGGIGSVVALRLAADGFAVAVHYGGKSQEADKVVAEIKSKGGKAIALKANVADQTEVQALFRNTCDSFGPIRVVVHAAGIMPLATIESGDLALFDKVIAINLRGTFIVLSEAAKAVEVGGRIVAFSSSVVAKAFPTYGAYIASKAGVEGLVHVLANEMRGRNITVNAVAPGPVATPLFLNGKTRPHLDELSKLAPLERLGCPEDIAPVVAFLVGPDGGWVNGQILRANGGFV
jgi:3-oxoacyl-[acyl-carrier protein] reductase